MPYCHHCNESFYSWEQLTEHHREVDVKNIKKSKTLKEKTAILKRGPSVWYGRSCKTETCQHGHAQCSFAPGGPCWVWHQEHCKRRSKTRSSFMDCACKWPEGIVSGRRTMLMADIFGR